MDSREELEKIAREEPDMRDVALIRLLKNKKTCRILPAQGHMHI